MVPARFAALFCKCWRFDGSIARRVPLDITHRGPSAEDGGCRIMHHGRTRLKHTGAFSAAILFTLGATAQLAFAEDLPPLKIGLMLPYKGVYAVPSEGIDRGFQVALAEYGNSVAGRRIEVIRADDELTPNVGVQQFNRLV